MNRISSRYQKIVKFWHNQRYFDLILEVKSGFYILDLFSQILNQIETVKKMKPSLHFEQGSGLPFEFPTTD
jgi:hypothetical protein